MSYPLGIRSCPPPSLPPSSTPSPSLLLQVHQHLRCTILSKVSGLSKHDLNHLMETVVAVVSGLDRSDAQQPRGWGRYLTRGPRSQGR